MNRQRCQRALLLVRENRALLLVAAAALFVRLVWNLWVHPPMNYAFSDMAGYVDRANLLFDKRWGPRASLSLFPYGTHSFVFAIKWLFGRDNVAAIGIAFALLGTGAVAFTYATARRFFRGRHPKALAILGTFFVGYYPWISLGGYVLSEMGFALFLAMTTFFSLRLWDRGRDVDAWLLGASIGLGAIFRPQMLLSGALLVGVWLFRRSSSSGPRRSQLALFATPIAFVLLFSAYRVHRDTGSIGLVSTNGPVNYLFGRCHCITFETRAKDGTTFFGPPPFSALAAYEKVHPWAPIRLAPALGEKIRVRGHMWDTDVVYGKANECVQTTGWAKQAYYAATHLVLLFTYNVIWPDQAVKEWRGAMIAWSYPFGAVFLAPTLVALAGSFARRRARDLLLTTHLLALLGVAVVYFGDTRFRAPYDGIFVTLALGVYAGGFRSLAHRFAEPRAHAGSG